MGFTTFFSDFSGAESVIFTLYNTHKHSLTSLSKNLNSLEMLINSHLLTVDTRLIGQKTIEAYLLFACIIHAYYCKMSPNLLDMK